MRRTGILVAAALAIAATPLLAEDTPTVGHIYITAPKAGMEQQYEAGRKKHMDWHKRQNDTWGWNTWQVLTGDHAGMYVTGTLSHRWKDFDEYGKLETADTADAVANMGAYSASTVNFFVGFLADVSRPPEGSGPSPMSELIHFQLKQGKDGEFRHAIKRIHEAIGKTSWPAHYLWYELLDGGEHPAYTLVLPMKTWADMAPLDPPFPVMLEKAFGREDAAAILKELDGSIHGQRSEIVRYRADLSYVPAPAGK